MGEYNPEFYTKFRHFVKTFMQTIYNIEVNGLENIPKDENYILAGNHLNILDAWLIMTLVDKNLRFMVDKKLYRYKSWEEFFTSIGTFPIDPESLDIKALKTLFTLLNNDESIVIFPEGKTHKMKENVPFKPGMAKISTRTKTPIIPFGISGTYRPLTTLNITIGSPINFKILDIEKEEYDSYLEETVRKLEKSNG